MIMVIVPFGMRANRHPKFWAPPPRDVFGIFPYHFRIVHSGSQYIWKIIWTVQTNYITKNTYVCYMLYCYFWYFVYMVWSDPWSKFMPEWQGRNSRPMRQRRSTVFVFRFLTIPARPSGLNKIGGVLNLNGNSAWVGGQIINQTCWLRLTSKILHQFIFYCLYYINII